MHQLMTNLEIDKAEMGITDSYRPSFRSVFPVLLKHVKDLKMMVDH